MTTTSTRRLLRHAPADQNEMTFAISIALHAGRTMRSGLEAAALKDDGTSVTDIHKTINEDVAAAVAARGEQMLGEVGSNYVPSSGRVWVCDPVDDTLLFAAGMPGCMFSLARVDDGKPTLGVIYDPWTDRLITASTGNGAHLNGRPITVNHTTNLAEACLALPGRPAHQLHVGPMLARVIEAGADMVTTGSAVSDAVMVALGLAAGAVYPCTSPWDMAAVAIVTTEAGGRITNLRGEDQHYDTAIYGAVLSNRRIHDELIDTVRGFIKSQHLPQ